MNIKVEQEKTVKETPTILESRCRVLRELIFDNEIDNFKDALLSVFEHLQEEIDRIAQDQRVIESIMKKRNEKTN